MRFLKNAVILLLTKIKHISQCETNGGENLIRKLAKFIFDYDLNMVPEEIRLKSKYVLIDTIGVMGAKNDFFKWKKNLFEENILLDALWLGVKLVENELDEGNALAKGHPACHFTPALLKLSECKQAPFEKLLTAFITGYEVGARIGEIITLKPGIHPHSNWGMIGGAAAIAKLYEWDIDQISQAINISAQFTYPTLWKSVLEGHKIRNIMIGMNNLTLIILPQLVESGYSASDETMETIFTQVLGNGFAKERLNLDASMHYLIHTYFKFYDSCRFCHGPIDALKEALKQAEVASVNEIQQIDVKTYASAAALNNQNVANSFAGKFSIPYALAKESFRFTNERFVENEIIHLAQKVNVMEDEEINNKLPKIRATKLTLTTKQHTSTVYLETAHGDEHTPNLYEHVEEKFYRNLKHLYSRNEVKALLRRILEEKEFPYELLK